MKPASRLATPESLEQMFAHLSRHGTVKHKAELRQVVSKYPGRWRETTVAALTATWPRRIRRAELPKMLDRLDRALAKVTEEFVERTRAKQAGKAVAQ